MTPDEVEALSTFEVEKALIIIGATPWEHYTRFSGAPAVKRSIGSIVADLDFRGLLPNWSVVDQRIVTGSALHFNEARDAANRALLREALTVATRTANSLA